MSASRDVKIRRATAKDAEAISRVHYAALDHDHLHDFYGAFFAIHPRKLIPRATAAALENPVNNFLVALDTDEVVGFIRWSIIPHARTQTIDSDGNAKEEQSRAERGSQQCQSPPLFAPKEHLKDLWHQFQYPREVEMDACYESAANGQRHVYIKHVMVHPLHQRRGVGAKLLSTVLATGDHEQVPVFLVASAEARGLYARLGFQDLGVWTINNEHWAWRIASREAELEIEGNNDLGEQLRGVGEEERSMVRWPA